MDGKERPVLTYVKTYGMPSQLRTSLRPSMHSL